MSELLLDTCAFIWVAAGDELKPQARRAVAAEHLHVSPITAWELAVHLRKGRITFAEPLDIWFRRAMQKMAASLPHLSVETLIASQALPGDPPADPADRIIIATARQHGLVLVTRDRAMLRYAEIGHVRAMDC